MWRRKADSDWMHLCIDMQRLFAEQTPWHIPWMEKIMPQVEAIASRFTDRTVFTRFITPRTAEDVSGAWRDYYSKWPEMTRDGLADAMLDLVPPLAALVPPAVVLDKMVYSPWHDGRLHRFLSSRGICRLAISGGETDVCVMAAVLGAIDYGYEVAVISDAICSSADSTHEAGLELLSSRFSVQVEVVRAEEFLREFG